MNQELISKWLGLAAENGLPNHYALLGLPPGEKSIERIEQQVHERMERVRHYQLSHPEEATEAMNRLAQALVCLTNPESKRAYDAGLASPAPGAAVGAGLPTPPPAKPASGAGQALGAGLPTPSSSKPPLPPRPPAPQPKNTGAVERRDEAFART